jgi:GAF domain-containing protein
VQPDASQLAALVTRLNQSVSDASGLEESLSSITQSAAANIPGVDWASISTTRRNGPIKTLAPTDPRVLKADEMQYELGEGPCVQAALEEHVVLVQDLAADSRWPKYGARAVELGIGGQLAFQFDAGHQTRGALNLYAGRPNAFDADSVSLAQMYASHVGTAMGWSRREESLN